MRITSFTRYTVIVLLHAALKRGELTTISDISEIYGISANHLMKVVHLLSANGYLETVKGRGGGLRLNLELQDIKLIDVLKLSEPDFNIVECFGDKRGKCQEIDSCKFSGVVDEALQNFFGVIEKYTFADIEKTNLFDLRQSM
ncbi:RrF2 family transcriptional regulator [Pseudemcibacter aquimaris]|uniref:RrF2 family transcriptional regulator n=1 Tax=Pseudemcibacter aquimaris TaxID=2857064 RepID=UPI0020117480|nr:Rrf2 family transcriptional regulator [Pseudemcibacter aquimaris]MCC3859589.1 Rrf2 family transcriptional regulator [Pseudemcibacter aquimaris]WDU59985.1 Rrf2 family transcriptional regulator [Pseudemcibacter aquimaris]